MRASAMLTATTVHRFGLFELDPATRWLFHRDDRVPLNEPQAAILSHLVVNAGQVISKEVLADVGWGAVAITDNSVDQAISRLRKVLGPQPDGSLYIETAKNRGYVFAAPVARGERLPWTDAPGDHLEADHACCEARRHLNTLKRDEIRRAWTRLEQLLQRVPDYPPALIPLTLAYALAFDATRVDAVPDLERLRAAALTGRRATARAPGSGEAWSNLAFAIFLNGVPAEAAAAASRAIVLEPGDVRHLLRLGYVSWGGDRMAAARGVLKMSGRVALAHWQAATVLIGRGAFDAARDELRQGCAAQDAEAAGDSILQGIGLHLLDGLVLAATGHLDQAAAQFERELERCQTDEHIYARECAANTWYALGGVFLRQGRRQGAEAAFPRALAIAPGHFSAAAALGQSIPALDAADPRATDAAIARAVALCRAGRHADAAQAYREAITAAVLPSAGWLLPVEPVLHAGAHPEVWGALLTIIHQRAI